LIVQRAGKVVEAEVERTWRRRRCWQQKWQQHQHPSGQPSSPWRPLIPVGSCCDPWVPIT